MSENYTINDIDSLNFRDAVRKRISMYLGSADMQGVYNSIQEIISNSVDEYYMGYGNKIEIALGTDNLITISDYGRGIPFGTKEDGSNVLVDIFSRSHTGGKFNNKVYSGVAGLNGIGAKATCLSSKKFAVGVWRDGKYAEAIFEEGLLKKYSERVATKADKNRIGTQIQFIPDEQVFNLEPIKIDFERLKDTCRNLSYLTKGLTFELLDYSKDKEDKHIFCAKNGLLDLLKDNVENPIHSSPIYYEFHDGVNKIEIALQWTKGREKSFVFTNGIPNVEGGTSLTGFRTAITRVLNKQFKKDFSGDLMRRGLVYAVSAMIPNPSFANQTKTKINNPELRGLVDKIFVEAWKEFSLRYPNDIEKVQDFLTKEEKADKAAEKARNAIINSTKEIEGAQKKKVLMADKLKDCERHGEEAILIICEGDSALGALSQGRPIENVALLPIRGKIINVLRHDIEKILENEEVKSILMCLNSGINEKYNSNRLRYGKIGIAVDADADGYNIMCLITTLIYGLFPQFMEEGRLHWLRAPLYRIDFKQEVCYAFNDDELESILRKKGKGKITRFKGLGEMDADDVEVAMFGQSQRLEKFIIKDKVNTYSQIEMLMGSEVEGRKKFIFDNIDFSTVEE